MALPSIVDPPCLHILGYFFLFLMSYDLELSILFRLGFTGPTVWHSQSWICHGWKSQCDGAPEDITWITFGPAPDEPLHGF